MARKRTKINQYHDQAEKQDRRLRRSIARAALVAGFLVLMVAFAFAAVFVYDFFTQCPYFAAKTITVTGNERVPAAELLEQAGIEPGDNILGVNLTVVRDRLEAHPWIATARVNRTLPDAITIDVTERKAMAILDLGQRFLMDEQGEVFKRYVSSDPTDLPLVTGLTFTDLAVPGEPMSRPYAAVVTFLQGRNTGDWGMSPDTIRAIAVDRDLGLTMVGFNPPVRVRLGYDRFGEKLRRLHQVIFDLNRKRGITAVSIDLINVDRVVVTPRPTEPASKRRPQKEV